MKRNPRTLYDCDRCMFTYKKKDLRRQRGMLLCDACFDSVLEIAPLNVRFLSPRVSTSLDPTTSPTVFTIGTVGVTYLAKSQVGNREGTTNSFVMHIIGDGPTTVTNTTQIVSGQQGTLLTLLGTDSTNYVIIKAGNGTDLNTDMVLKTGNTLSLVYNTTSSLWCETSRS